MKNSPYLLLRFALFLLLFALVLGVLIAFAYFKKDLWGTYFPFEKLRPMHVSSAIFWILSAAQGLVFYFVKEHFKELSKREWLIKLSQGLWMGSVALALGSFLLGEYGGREYWEFPPIINLPILLGWLCFAAYLYPVVFAKFRSQPVYVWLWSTGTLFFILSFIESNLWMLPWFRENFIRDITVQWKANGAIVGAWNQLIYGLVFYLMTRISGKEDSATSWQAFFFYFLGMANLMFNWGHHTYNVPAASWVRHVAYIISMTEWVFLLNMLYSFRKKLTHAKKLANWVSYHFISAAEVWIFLNLLLALAMSIPAINRYTHGTHIVVAHAMGTTIGINSMILFGALFYIAEKAHTTLLARFRKWIRAGFLISNISLFIFWLGLIAAGVVKARLMVVENQPFQVAMKAAKPYLLGFSYAGIGLLTGFGICAILLLRLLRPAEISDVNKQETD
ncbi:MAG: cbb3-type cytochrome c oxidase subunit I [Bacteroidia bacterium]